MFRNMYDTDATTFSPLGRLHQVEYAMEAVKQGSACVGLRSKEFAVLAAIKRSPSELASFQKKIHRIDDHMGIAISGLVADARVLAKYMQNECLNHKYVYETPMQTGRLVQQLSDKAQVYTQKSEKRPYGVGLLVAGCDATGPHIFYTVPSGNFFEYKAMAMGARSQSSKTYFEKHFETFEDLPLKDLIRHALMALKGALQAKITTKNVSIGYVGMDTPFTLLDDDAAAPYVTLLAQEDDDEDDDDEEKGDGGSGSKASSSAASSSSTSTSTSSSTPSTSTPSSSTSPNVMDEST